METGVRSSPETTQISSKLSLMICDVRDLRIRYLFYGVIESVSKCCMLERRIGLNSLIVFFLNFAPIPEILKLAILSAWYLYYLLVLYDFTACKTEEVEHPLWRRHDWFTRLALYSLAVIQFNGSGGLKSDKDSELLPLR
ncbi:hypothetical protein Leryth_024713 [Lithospermum erythrorhizon]|nr:hypothetical protein Leryth_024713 [Lithospermum erythrorhizon]